MSVDVRRAIYGKLAGDGTLVSYLATAPTGYSKSIYYQVAPSSAAFPYIIFNQQAGTPRYTFGGLAMDNEIWLVKGVDRQPNIGGDTTPVDNIASRATVLLTDGTISISGKTQLYLRRDTDLPPYSEVSGDQRFMHNGALFRLVYT